MLSKDAAGGCLSRTPPPRASKERLGLGIVLGDRQVPPAPGPTPRPPPRPPRRPPPSVLPPCSSPSASPPSQPRPAPPRALFPPRRLRTMRNSSAGTRSPPAAARLLLAVPAFGPRRGLGNVPRHGPGPVPHPGAVKRSAPRAKPAVLSAGGSALTLASGGRHFLRAAGGCVPPDGVSP